MIERKRNIAGYTDEFGRFRPIRSPQFVGRPSRKARVSDRKKYSRAKAGDLGKARQIRAREDIFQREIRLQKESRAAKAREMKRIESEWLGDQSEGGKGQTLVEFVRSSGGIRPTYKFGGKKDRGKRVTYDRGELEGLMYKDSGKRGIASEKGKYTLDDMFKRVREAGYGVNDPWEMLNAMDEEIRNGKPTYANFGYLDYRDNPAAGDAYTLTIYDRNNNVKSVNVIDAKTGKAIAKYKSIAGAKRFAKSKGIALEVNPAKFVWVRRHNHLWVLLHDDDNGEMIARLTHNSGQSYTVDVSSVGEKTFRATSIPAAKATALSFVRSKIGTYRDYKRSQPSVAYVNKIINRSAIAKHGKVTRIEPVAFTSDKYRIVFADGYSQESKIPKMNPKSDLYVSQLGSRSFGVFLKTYLLKKFTTRIAAENYAQSIRSRVKGNPASAARLAKAAISIFDNDLDLDVDAKDLRRLQSATRKLASRRKNGGRSIKQNPVDPLGMFANAAVGIASALQIKEYLNKPQRAAKPKRKTNGKTSAKRNPAGHAGGQRFAEREFDRDLFAIEEGNGRKVRSATAHGKQAGYSKREIDWLVRRAKLAAKMKVKVNPAAMKTEMRKALKANPSRSAAGKKAAAGSRKAIAAATNPAMKLPKTQADLVRKMKEGRHLVRFTRGGWRLKGGAGYFRVNKAVCEALVKKGVLVRGGKNLSEVGPTDTQFVLSKSNPKIRQKKFFVRLDHPERFARPDQLDGAYLAFNGKRMSYTRGEAIKKARMFGGGKIEAVTAASMRSNPEARCSCGHLKSGHTRDVVGGKLQPPKGCLLCPCGKFKLSRKLKTVGDVAAAMRTSERKKGNPAKPPRSRTFEMFQGRPVTTAKQMPISKHAPARVSQLGDLVEIKLVGRPAMKLNPNKFKLCAANGKLWIVGGKFARSNPAAKANEINPIGKIDHVVYGTRKPHHGDNAYTHYIHKLGEDSGVRPLLTVDREGFPVIRGGNYKIEARGIVD